MKLIIFLMIITTQGFSANKTCVDLFNKLKCGYNLNCIISKSDQIPNECKKDYDAWTEKAIGQDPCEIERKKVCKGEKCDQMQMSRLSKKCKQAYIKDQNMENSATNMGTSCKEDFKKVCDVDLSTGSGGGQKMVKCLQDKKSQFSLTCQKAIKQMLGGSI